MTRPPMKTSKELVDALVSASRPDAESSLVLVPGDHVAIGQLAEQIAWGADVAEWLKQSNGAIKHSFAAYRAQKKGAMI